MDPAALDRVRRIGGDALLSELIHIFLADAEPRLERIRAGLSGPCVADARAAAHALKSSAGNVGAVTLQGLCAAVERGAAEGPLTPAQVEAVEAELCRVRRWLERFLGPSHASYLHR